MKKSLVMAGIGAAVGSFRIPGQGPRLILQKRPRMQYDTSSLSRLTEPAKPLEGPVIPGDTTDIVRTPADITRGIAMDLNDRRRFEQKMQELGQEPNMITFRKRLIECLRSFAPQELVVRQELGRRAGLYYKSTAASRWNRRPGREGERLIIQKSRKVPETGSLGKSITDADLAVLRQRLVMLPVSGPPELVWMAEAAGDTLHVRPEPQPPPGYSDALEKGATHKFIKRVPTGKPKPKYRYVYKVPSRKGLTTTDDLVEGAKFMVEHHGQQGHFEVRSVGDNGTVTVRHDESGKTIRLKQVDLHRWLESHHARKIKRAAAEQLEREKPDPLELVRPHTQGELNLGKPEPKPAEKPAPALDRIGLGDLGKGGYDQIEGFSEDPAELERIATGLPSDREYALVKQSRGYALASRQPAVTGKEAVGEGTEVFLKGEGGRGIQKLDAEWVVMEADDVVPSHDPVTFTKRNEYPEGVQERRYDQIRSEQIKLERIANNLEPAIVANTNPDAINGAPIVTEDGIVLGGNGRTMGIQRAYKLYPEKAKAMATYLQQHARAFGLSAAAVAGMKQPILVRRTKAGKDPEKLKRLGRRMNEALTQGLDQRSKDVAHSAFVTPEVLDGLLARMEPDETLNGFLSSSKSRDFVKQLERAGIIDEQNRAEFLDEDTGLLNEDGRTRVTRTLAARMVPDATLLDSMPAKWRESLALATPQMIQAEDAGWDLREPLAQALRTDRAMQVAGFKRTAADRSAFERQQGMFGGDKPKLGKAGEVMLQVLQEHGDKVRGFPKMMKQLALEAARQQHDHGAIASMFPEPKKSMEQVLRQVFDIEDRKTASGLPVDDLRKSEVRAGLYAYLSQALMWELDNLMRGEIVVAGGTGKANGPRLVKRLRQFLQDQARTDKKFAQALGAHPVSDEMLRHLVRLKAQASVMRLAKSLAVHSLWHNAERIRAHAH